MLLRLGTGWTTIQPTPSLRTASENAPLQHVTMARWFMNLCEVLSTKHGRKNVVCIIFLTASNRRLELISYMRLTSESLTAIPALPIALFLFPHIRVSQQVVRTGTTKAELFVQDVCYYTYSIWKQGILDPLLPAASRFDHQKGLIAMPNAIRALLIYKYEASWLWYQI